MHEPEAGPTAAVVHVNVGSHEEAHLIAQAVVAERLAACANLINGVSSLYWWQGEIEEAAETMLVLKTRRALLPALAARIRALHSYDCPGIVALPIVFGDDAYMRWIEQETRAD